MTPSDDLEGPVRPCMEAGLAPNEGSAAEALASELDPGRVVGAAGQRAEPPATPDSSRFSSS